MNYPKPLFALVLSCVTVGVASTPARAESQKSEGVATALSTAGALAGPAAFLGGVYLAILAEDDPSPPLAMGALALSGAFMVVGPSFGHWYAGDWRSRQLLIRGGAVGALVGLSWMAETCESCKTASSVLAIAGVMTLLASSVHDVSTASASARRYNAQQRQLMLAPVANWQTGQRVLGLQLAGTF